MTLSVIESSSGIWGLRVKISLMTVLQMCRNNSVLVRRVLDHRAFSFYFLVNPFLQLRSNKTNQSEFQLLSTFQELWEIRRQIPAPSV